MSFLLPITVFLFSIGQLGRISLFNQRVNFYLYEIFIILSIIYLLFHFKFKPLIKSFQKLKYYYFFFASLVVSYLINLTQFNFFQNLIAFLYLARIGTYFLYGVFLSYWVKKNSQKSTISFSTISLSCLIIFFSFFQYLLYPDLRNLRYLGWDEHLYRMFGLFFDTSIAAAIYGMFFLYFYKQKNINKKIKLFFLFLYLIAIVLSFSRATYLIIFVVLLTDLIIKKRIKSIFLFFTVFFLLLVLAPKPFGEGVNLKRQFSILSRINDYHLAIDLWKKYPILGIGYNRIGFYKNIELNFPSHSSFSFSSSYLIILVCGGIIGFFLFLSGLLKLLKINKKARIYLIFVYLLSFFDNVILHPFIIFILILFLISNS